MNNTTRLIIALVCGAVVTALAAPEISGKLPAGTAQTIAAILTIVLHKVNDVAPPSATAALDPAPVAK